MGATLVVNPGSSSRKYALFDKGTLLLEIRFETTNAGYEMCTQHAVEQQSCVSISENEFAEALPLVAEKVKVYLKRELAGKQLETVVVRVVAPGTYFQNHGEIDEGYIKILKKRESSAPLHVPIILRELKEIKKQFPDVRIIAASDSAFHATLPPQTREYSLQTDDANAYDIHRFGYHGLSIASIVRRIHAIIGVDPERMIVCHIGNGTSVTAVKKGKSVETTMGFSPTTGLPMGSRAGDLDSGALLELMRVKNLRPAEAELYINTQGGLTAMAKDSDIRRLLDRRCQRDPVAIHALDVFAYNIQKAIAAQTVALGGLEVLVFTATAAVRSSELRKLILQGVTHLGVQVSDDRNDVLIGRDGVISVRNSPVKIVVMRTDEMGEMAHVAREFTLLKQL